MVRRIQLDHIAPAFVASPTRRASRATLPRKREREEAGASRECAPDDRLGDEAIQRSSHQALDGFAEPVIGPRFSPARWLAVTVCGSD
jgi:hypothetical protein